MNPYRILIVDDHPVVREGIKVVLSQWKDIQCEGCCSIEKLMKLLACGNKNAYDLYIVDLEFPQCDAMATLEEIRKNSPQGRILIYTIHEEPWIISKLDEENIDGFLCKNSSVEELQQAIESIREGKTYFSDSFLKIKKGRGRNAGDNHGEFLSKREKQVLTYLSKGYSTREIAEMMNLSPFTIKTYRTRLTRKLHAKNTVDIVRKGTEFL